MSSVTLFVAEPFRSWAFPHPILCLSQSMGCFKRALSPVVYLRGEPRVGDKTIASVPSPRTRRGEEILARVWARGRRNAIVFPDPVLERTTTSRPAR